MKNQFAITSLFLMSFAFTQSAHADLSSAAGNIISALGVKAAQTATSSCDVDNMIKNYGPGDGGRLAAVNVIPCVVKKLGLTGATGSSGSTKLNAVTVSGVALNVHVVINAGPITVDGKSYDWEMKIWACSGTCSGVTSYYPLAYMVFSSDSSGKTNKGVLALNSNAQTGAITESQFIRWDTGSSTTTKTIDNIVVECSGHLARTMSYTRVGDDAKMSIISSSSGNGAAIAWNWSTNEGRWGEDATATVGGAPSVGGQFSRTASTYDFTYAAGGSSSATLLAYPSFVSIANLQGANYSQISCSTIATSGVPNVVTGLGILSTPITAMGGMTTNPPNL